MSVTVKTWVWNFLEWLHIGVFIFGGIWFFSSLPVEPSPEFSDEFGAPAIVVAVGAFVGILISNYFEGTCVERLEAVIPDRVEEAAKKYSGLRMVGSLTLKHLVLEGALRDSRDSTLRTYFVLHRVFYWASYSTGILAVDFLNWIGWVEG